MASKRHALRMQTRMLLVFLMCLNSISVALDPYYIAISLGPKYLTAAQFAADQAPIPLTHITGSDAYQAYYADTLLNEGQRIQRSGQWYTPDGEYIIPAPIHDERQAQTIFASAMRTIEEAALKALHRPVEIATVSRPRHFNHSSQEAVIKAAMEIEPAMKQPKQVIDAVDAARLAYGLDSCEGFGLNKTMCDIEEDLHLLLFIDYNNDYIELSVAEVTDKALKTKGHFRFRGLGAAKLGNTPAGGKSWLDRLRNVLIRDSPAPAPAATPKETHYQSIQDVLRAFMAKRKLTPGQHLDSNSLRAVVISGDAPASAFEDLLTWVAAALGEQKDKIRNSIDPLFVGAVGAAQRGRRQLINARSSDDVVSTNSVPRDEL